MIAAISRLRFNYDLLHSTARPRVLFSIAALVIGVSLGIYYLVKTFSLANIFLSAGAMPMWISLLVPILTPVIIIAGIRASRFLIRSWEDNPRRIVNKVDLSRLVLQPSKEEDSKLRASLEENTTQLYELAQQIVALYEKEKDVQNEQLQVLKANFLALKVQNKGILDSLFNNDWYINKSNKTKLVMNKKYIEASITVYPDLKEIFSPDQEEDITLSADQEEKNIAIELNGIEQEKIDTLMTAGTHLLEKLKAVLNLHSTSGQLQNLIQLKALNDNFQTAIDSCQDEKLKVGEIVFSFINQLQSAIADSTVGNLTLEIKLEHEWKRDYLIQTTSKLKSKLEEILKLEGEPGLSEQKKIKEEIKKWREIFADALINYNHYQEYTKVKEIFPIVQEIIDIEEEIEHTFPWIIDSYTHPVERQEHKADLQVGVDENKSDSPTTEKSKKKVSWPTVMDENLEPYEAGNGLEGVVAKAYSTVDIHRKLNSDVTEQKQEVASIGKDVNNNNVNEKISNAKGKQLKSILKPPKPLSEEPTSLAIKI